MGKIPLTDEERAFRLSCPKSDFKKQVSPITCRICDSKKTCPEVQGLLSSKREYYEKYKGTILESAMKSLAKKKENIAKFILGDEL